MRLSRAQPIQPGRAPRMEVVVPCYNYGAYLPGCVESILAQPGLDLRVTIVDDASPDGSGQVADALAARDLRVRVLHNAQNLGMIGTFNRGIGQVDSDYMLLISADDMVAPGALTRAAAFLQAHPSVGLVYGHAQKFAHEPVVRGSYPFVTWSRWRGDDWIRMQLRRSWSNISSPEAVVRTSVQHAVGEYDPTLPHTLDVEMWLRIADVADVGHVNGIDQAYYRRQPGSYSARFSTYADIEERWRAYDQFLTRWDRPGEADRWRLRVRRNLAREALRTLVGDLERGGEVEEELTTRVRELIARIDPDAFASPLWADAQSLMGHDVRPRAGYARRRLQRSVADAARWPRWRRMRYWG